MIGFVGVLVALVVTGLLLPLLAAFLRRRQLWDVPNHRSAHAAPVLRGGGVAVAVGIVVGSIVAAPGLDTSTVLVVAAAVALCSGIGMVEDLRGLSVIGRLLGQSLCGLLLAVLAVRAGSLLAAACVVAAAVFWVNATNFMDGVNGISSVHGLLFAAYYAIVGSIMGSPTLTAIAMVVGVAFLMFLPWNWPRARMFLGDVGSYALGISSLALALMAYLGGASPVVALAPGIPYAADVAVTLARRLLQGQQLTAAHRDHTYQQILRISGSHSVASVSCAATTALCGSAALLLATRPWMAATLMVLVTGTYLLVPSISRWWAAGHPGRHDQVNRAGTHA